MEAKINLTPETLCLWGPIAAGWQPGATEMESQSGQNKKEKFFSSFWHRNSTFDTAKEMQQIPNMDQGKKYSSAV